MNKLSEISAFTLDIIETVVVALSVFVIIYLFLFQPHQVRGASMEPNFFDGDYILTDKLTYRFRPPSPGEVIIFRAPRKPEYDYIKRVIAVPGDKVRITGGKVFINDQPLNESYLKSQTVLFPGSYFKEGEDYPVKENEYIVIGDNRAHSSDSREWGPVPIKDIIGKAFFRYWPPSEIGLVNKPLY